MTSRPKNWSVFHWSEWSGHDGENAMAQCNDPDDACGWEVGGLTLRQATRQAEDHASSTGHPVIVERTLWRVVEHRP